MADVGPGNHEAIGVDGIGRIRNQYRIPWPHGGQCQVGQPLLRADGNDRLPLRIQLDVVALQVPVADSTAQARDPPGDGVAMGVVPLRHFHQLVHDVFRSGLVGIAHSEIDDIFTAGSGLGLQLVDDVEDIGRQTLDARKLFDQCSKSGEM